MTKQKAVARFTINGVEVVLPIELELEAIEAEEEQPEPLDPAPAEEEYDDLEEEAEVEAPAVEPVTQADKVLDFARKYLKVEYKYGAPGVFQKGFSEKLFDCSSFVQYVFYKAAGLKGPRTARPQAIVGKAVSKRADLQKGDLVFFSTTTTAAKYSRDDIKRVGHVGIVAGRDNQGNIIVLHTYKKGVGVTYSALKPGGYWDKHLLFGRRVL